MSLELLRVIEDNHEALRASGVRLLQPFRYQDTDEGHVAFVVSLAGEIPRGARVLDVGCGVGEFARILSALRPDLAIVLVNFSQSQLADCPPGLEQHLADAHNLPFESASFDAVFFNAALGNMRAHRAVHEAARVLRDGGVMLLNELELQAGDGDGAERLLRYRPIRQHELTRSAVAFDLGIEAVIEPPIAREFLREAWLADQPTDYDTAMAGVRPKIWRLRKLVTDHGRRLTAYARPALHFSGGKDSLACLYLLREHLDKITVYWLNTGDGCPETLAVVDEVRQWIPHFVEVRSDVAAWRMAHGFPSDIVPAKAHRIGVMYGLNSFGLTNRFDCCAANIMAPIHARMLADGVDLVIRGTKATDTGRVPAAGPVDGYDVWLPIAHWTHNEVFGYLASVGAPTNPIYDHFRGISAPECIGCTAWWDDGKADYLRHRHPDRLAEYQDNLRAIRLTLASHLKDLDTEIGD